MLLYGAPFVFGSINGPTSFLRLPIFILTGGFKLVLKWFAIFQFDIDLAAPECLPFVEGWVTFERKWWVEVSIPFIGGFFVTLAETSPVPGK